MLGHVTRWLRLMGFDAQYAGSELSDEEILDRAGATGRILVTRDRVLHHRAQRQRLASVLLADGSLPQELAGLLDAVGAPLAQESLFTRCTHCNASLEDARPQDVADRVPARVLGSQERFSRCPHCGQVYWQGTHVDEIRRTLGEVDQELARRRRAATGEAPV